MSLDVRTHTALHVVKGAIFKVLGAKWSTSAASEGSHGRIAVELDRKPTDEEEAEIQRLVDQKVREDARIEVQEMSRSAPTATS